jgi:hypothetical protein
MPVIPEKSAVNPPRLNLLLTMFGKGWRKPAENPPFTISSGVFPAPALSIP